MCIGKSVVLYYYGDVWFRPCKLDLDAENTSGSDDSSSVFESAARSYTSEEILQILLNPTIHPHIICKTRPSNITKSDTYIVDLDCLEHPDDVRRDEFGRWNYSGSHVFYYRTEKTDDDLLEFERVLPGTQGDNIFQLRQIHCKHPSNPNFQRLLAFITGKLHTC